MSVDHRTDEKSISPKMFQVVVNTEYRADNVEVFRNGIDTIPNCSEYGT